MSAESDARTLSDIREWRKIAYVGRRIEVVVTVAQLDLLLRIADERDQLRRDLCTEPEPKPVTDPWEESQSTPDTRTITADMAVIRAEYAPKVGALQIAHWERRGYTNHLGSAAGRAFRDGAWAGIRLVLNRQHGIDDLTTGQKLAELRKGTGSIYWPLLSADPMLSADCPRCNREVLVDAQGLCPQCAYEFQEVD